MTQRLLHNIEALGYPAFALAMMSNVGSELFLPFAGFLVWLWKMNLWIAIIIGGVASYIGSIILYLIGRWDNKDKIHTFVQKYGKYIFISTKEVDQWFAFFAKYGIISVFLWRFVPVIRAAVSFPAGAIKMPFWQYTIVTLLGDTGWSALLILLGYQFGENYTQVQELMSKYQHIVIPVLIVCVVLWIWRNICIKVYRRR